MKKIAYLSLLAACAGLFNVGCAASGSIKPASATSVSHDKQMAYIVTVEKK